MTDSDQTDPTVTMKKSELEAAIAAAVEQALTPDKTMAQVAAETAQAAVQDASASAGTVTPVDVGASQVAASSAATQASTSVVPESAAELAMSIADDVEKAATMQMAADESSTDSPSASPHPVGATSTDLLKSVVEGAVVEGATVTRTYADGSQSVQNFTSEDAAHEYAMSCIPQ
jgi:hypothetical protein